VFNGSRPWTQADLDERFSPGFAEGFGVDRLTEASDAAIAERGTTRFVRVLERDPGSIRALGVAEDGTPMVVWIQTPKNERIGSLLLEVVPSPPRLEVWESALLILAGAGFAAAAAVTTRLDRDSRTWLFVLGSVAALCGVLVLNDGALLYTLGRVVPALLVPIAAVVLLDSVDARPGRWVTLVAAAAMVLSGVAPLFRDAALVGHPQLWGSITDNESAYRALLVGASALTGVAMGAVAVIAARNAGRALKGRRPTVWLAALAGMIWSFGAIGSAIDYTNSAGTWAGGPFSACTLVGAALVPAVAFARVLGNQWDSAGIAALVVDLESQDAELGIAVARALDDPSLVVVTSPDGQVLLDDDGNLIESASLATGQALTEIRATTRLVGGLVHDAALRNDPERLKAVASAAGLALEVDRLNRQVSAQLDDANASRTRIVQAADTARRQVERDLHDGAQQRLVALGLQLQRARRMARSRDESELAHLLENATSEVRQSIDDIRAVSRGLQPALLAERGLGPAVDALAERSPIPVRIDISLGGHGDLDAEIATTMYFVIAEALANVAKHANATQADVGVSCANGRLNIRVSDDGRGGARASAGSGLEGLADRVAAASGTINVSSNDRGTTVEATLPCG